MSKYTTEVRYICETSVENPDEYPSITQLISAAAPNVFNFSWPVWDENYRNVLATDILRHYYTREIGSETVGLWKLRMESRLNEIMPYYNQLYKSTVLDFNPLYNVDLRTTHEASGTQRSNNETSNTTEKTDTKTVNLRDHEIREETKTATTDDTNTITKSGTNNESGGLDSTTDNTLSTAGTTENTEAQSNTETLAFSDTPQGALTDVQELSYLTSANVNTRTQNNTANGETSGTSTGKTKVKDTTTKQGSFSESNSDTGKTEYSDEVNIDSDRTNTGTESNTGNETMTGTASGNISTTDEYVQHVVGMQGGSYAKMILEFRETLINIERMIIDDLADMFMLIY